MICRHGNLSKKHNYWIPLCFKAVIWDFHRISSCHWFDKKSVCKDGNDGSDGDPDFHLIHTGLTPSPTFPPRGAEADMPGVLQYHVESWVWEIWRGVWADEKGVWGQNCGVMTAAPYSSPSLESPSPLAIASDVPVSELSAPFWLPSKKSVLQMHYLTPSFLRRVLHFPKTLS